MSQTIHVLTPHLYIYVICIYIFFFIYCRNRRHRKETPPNTPLLGLALHARLSTNLQGQCVRSAIRKHLRPQRQPHLQALKTTKTTAGFTPLTCITTTESTNLRVERFLSRSSAKVFRWEERWTALASERSFRPASRMHWLSSMDRPNPRLCKLKPCIFPNK